MHHNIHKSKYHEVSFKNSEEEYPSYGMIQKHGVELVPSDLEMEMNNTDEINQRTIEMESGKNWLSSDGNNFQEILENSKNPLISSSESCLSKDWSEKSLLSTNQI